MSRKWEPKNHPSNTLPSPVAEAVRKVLSGLYCIPPGEMFTVLMERQEIMVYVPEGYLNDLIWELADTLAGTKVSKGEQ